MRDRGWERGRKSMIREGKTDGAKRKYENGSMEKK